MNNFRGFDVALTSTVCFVLGVVITGALLGMPEGMKPNRVVCKEKGGLYINSTCVKVETIDLKVETIDLGERNE